jgi:3-oxoacyl-[acyl-carrier protein] reductase
MLKGKKAVITGGNSGIGKAIASLFFENGADVAILGTNIDKLSSAVKEIDEKRTNPSQKILSFGVDVSDYNLVQKTFEEILKDFFNIDILVNNAGITKDNLFLRMSEEDWDRVIDVNLKSVYNTCKAIIRPMLKSRYGKIINITSVVGLMGNAGQANYAASKAGMIGFTKSLAKELASRNICVNCIAPGFIKTNMTESLTDQVKEELLKNIPMQKLGEPLDVANAAFFLASSKSNYITGQVITVDGGMVM